MADLPRPTFSIAEAARLLVSHDGDDRGGRLSGTLIELLKAREEAETPDGFVRAFDEVLAEMAGYRGQGR